MTDNPNPPINLEHLKTTMMLKYDQEPAKAKLAEQALDEISHGIDEMAKLGYSYWLIEFDKAYKTKPLHEWPKMMYHDREAPHGRVFKTERDAPTGPGWRETPSAMPMHPASIMPKPMGDPTRQDPDPAKPTMKPPTGVSGVMGGKPVVGK